MIQVTDLAKTFHEDDGPVLEDITFSLSAGDTLSVIGPSGCGKTTLLYLLAGLIKPGSGLISLGESGRGGAVGGNVAIVLQDFGLFPWKTARENVALALKIKKASPETIKKTTLDRLEEMGLSEFAERYPVQLSGGQKQRVAIARALAASPDILLMDEPFSSLDALTRERLQNTILDLWKRRRLTYVIVTHNVEEAVFLGRFIMVLGGRPGRIKAWLPNDSFGDQALRMDDSYFHRIKQVRQVLAGEPMDPEVAFK